MNRQELIRHLQSSIASREYIISQFWEAYSDKRNPDFALNYTKCEAKRLGTTQRYEKDLLRELINHDKLFKAYLSNIEYINARF